MRSTDSPAVVSITRPRRGCDSRRKRASDRPFSPGMLTSRMARSAASATRRRAIAASLRLAHLEAVAAEILGQQRRSSGSSSTTRTTERCRGQSRPVHDPGGSERAGSYRPRPAGASQRTRAGAGTWFSAWRRRAGRAASGTGFGQRGVGARPADPRRSTRCGRPPASSSTMSGSGRAAGRARRCQRDGATEQAGQHQLDMAHPRRDGAHRRPAAYRSRFDPAPPCFVCFASLSWAACPSARRPAGGGHLLAPCSFEEENQVFEGRGRPRLHAAAARAPGAPAKPGVAFSLVNKLLAFNTPGDPRVEW